MGLFDELFINCFNRSCYANLTNLLFNFSVTEEVIFFARPSEILTPWEINPYFKAIITTYLITFLIGVIGNIIVVTLTLRDPDNSVTSLFLASLAIADLLILTICAPLDVAHYFVVQWDEGGTVCKLSAYAESVSAFASVLNLMAVTLERYIVIIHPIGARSICTRKRSRRLLFCVWLAAFLLATPVIFMKATIKIILTNYVDTVTIYSCKDISDRRGIIIAIYNFITLFLLPNLKMGFCYYRVVTKLWNSTRTLDDLTCSSDLGQSQDSISQDRRRCERNASFLKVSRKQVIRMLVAIVVFFNLCWGPRFFLEIILKYYTNNYSHEIYIVRYILHLLPYVHSSLNPFIYCFMSSKFQDRLRQCFFCKKAPRREFQRNTIQLQVPVSRNIPSPNLSINQ